MEYAVLGDSGVKVTRVALGTWGMGGWLWGGADEAAGQQAVEEAIQNGITTIDTAAVYGFGLSEKLIARAIKALGVPREKLVLATKCGLSWDDKGNTWRDSSPAKIRQELEDSLKRLETDYIDLYQVHWPDPNTPIEQTAEVLRELWEAGKIKAIGVSNYNVEQMERWRKVAPLHTLQPPYNLFDRGIEAEILPYAREHGIAVLAYSPLKRGLLAGHMTPETTFPPGDSRAEKPEFQGERFRRNLAIVERLKEIAARRGKSVAQLAVRWVLDQQGVTVALWGARRPGQIKEALGAMDWSLTEEERAEIEAAFAQA